MPGFAAAPDVGVRGGEYAAAVSTDLSCDGLVGWLQAGDWRIDSDALAPLPSETPQPGGASVPRLRWLVLSRPGDIALARLGAREGETGCSGLISRFSVEDFAVEGAVSASTRSRAYQLMCNPSPGIATVTTLYFGDDGTVGAIRVEIPLALGTQPIASAVVSVGRYDVAPADLAGALAGSLTGVAQDLVLGRTAAFESGEEDGDAGSANVESVDPLIASLDLHDLQGDDGGILSFRGSIRCDVTSNALSQAASMPVATEEPSPTSGPVGHLEVTVGTGPSAFHESLDTSGLTCDAGLVTPGDWLLTWSSETDSPGLRSVLLTAGGDETSLTVMVGSDDFYVAEEDTLEVSIDDRGSEVEFMATSRTHDDTPLTLSATCRDVSRF